MEDLSNMSAHELAKRVFVFEAKTGGMLAITAEKVWYRHERTNSEVYKTRVVFAAAHINCAVQLVNEANASKIPHPNMGIRPVEPT